MQPRAVDPLEFRYKPFSYRHSGALENWSRSVVSVHAIDGLLGQRQQTVLFSGAVAHAAQLEGKELAPFGDNNARSVAANSR